MAKKGGMGGSGSILKGLKTRSVSSALPAPKGKSVSDGACRSETAKHSPTIGPRSA
jgi:hypothetical protein